MRNVNRDLAMLDAHMTAAHGARFSLERTINDPHESTLAKGGGDRGYSDNAY